LVHNQPNEALNRGYQARRKLPYKNGEIEMFTISNSDFYVISTKADTGAIYKFLDATLHVKHVKPSPTIPLAHAKALEKVNARYDMTRVSLKYSLSGQA